MRHCALSRKVAGSIPEAVIGIFYSPNPSGRIMALGPVTKAAKLTTFMYRLS